jgi:hypothetical protein
MQNVRGDSWGKIHGTETVAEPWPTQYTNAVDNKGGEP